MSTKKEQILDLLLKYQYVYSPSLADIQNRFGASILILRKEGHKIVGEPKGVGLWRYEHKGRTKKPYETAKLTCPRCGFHGVPRRDARKSRRTG